MEAKNDRQKADNDDDDRDVINKIPGVGFMRRQESEESSINKSRLKSCGL